MRVELGCGTTKRDGFFGIDRFPLQGVDLVADLNKEIPLADDSVDFVYACHSLEHLENTEHIFNEIYRICRNGAIVTVLSPYYFQTLNVSNFYHKSPYTEDTLRFLTDYDSSMIPKADYQYGFHPIYGLSRSDNSDANICFEPLYTEFFYYPPYRGLSESERLYARKTLLNVCDQFYAALVVNKTGEPLHHDVLMGYEKYARENEPEVLKQLRIRDSFMEESRPNTIPSIFDMIADAKSASQVFCEETVSDIKTQLASIQDDVRREIAENVNVYNEKFSRAETERQRMNDDLHDELSQAQTEQRRANDVIIARLSQMQEIWEKRYRSLLAHYIEQCATTHSHWSTQKTSGIFQRNQAMFDNIRMTHPQFFEGLWLNHPQVRKGSLFLLSAFLPYASYHEYPINGYGNRLHLFLVCVPDSSLYVEIVQNGVITDGIQLRTGGDGPVTLTLSQEISGTAYCRFKVLDNTGIVRVLELQRKTAFMMARILLAAYISKGDEDVS